MLLLRAILTLVGLVGLGQIGIAVHRVRSNLRYLRSGRRVRATVERSFRRRLVRGSRSYVRVSYALDGKSHLGEGEVSVNYADGEEVDVAVLDGIADVLVVHAFSNWWLPVLLTVSGLGLAWLGFAHLLRG